MIDIRLSLWRALEAICNIHPKAFWRSVYAVRYALKRMRTVKRVFTLRLHPTDAPPFVQNPSNFFAEPNFREQFLLASGLRPYDFNFRFERNFRGNELQVLERETNRIKHDYEVLAFKATLNPYYGSLQAIHDFWVAVQNRFKRPTNKAHYEIYCLARHNVRQCRRMSR